MKCLEGGARKFFIAFHRFGGLFVSYIYGIMEWLRYFVLARFIRLSV